MSIFSSEITIKKEKITIAFKDKYIALVNSIRRKLYEGHNYYQFNIVKFSHNKNTFRVEEMQKALSHVLINHKELKKIKGGNLTFSLGSDKENKQIFSQYIVIKNNGKIISNEKLIRKDQYIITADIEDIFEVEGNIIKKKNTMIHNATYDYKIIDSMFEGIFEFSVKEINTPCKIFEKALKDLRKDINDTNIVVKDTKKTQYIKMDSISPTITNLLEQHILYTKPGNIFVAKNENKDTLIHTITFKGDKNVIEDSKKEIIDKINKILLMIKNTPKEFNTIIDDY